MADARWVPPGGDADTPSTARLYDYFLGGGCNFAVDRELGDRIRQVLPQVPYMAQLNRAFMRRAVLHCVAAGIRQFLDLGCGLVSVGPPHELAQRVDPECRIVYVDNDPVAVAHNELLVAGNDRVRTIVADVRDHESVLGHERTRELIDFSEPVGVVMTGLLHFIPDEDDPAGIVARYAKVMAPGSHLVLSHVTGDAVPPETVAKSVALYSHSQSDIFPRPHAGVAAMLAEFELVEPGLVFVPAWRPDGPLDGDYAARSSFYGAVGFRGVSN